MRPALRSHDDRRVRPQRERAGPDAHLVARHPLRADEPVTRELDRAEPAVIGDGRDRRRPQQHERGGRVGDALSDRRHGGQSLVRAR